MSPPVYRYPPRSHAYSCRCRRCAPFRGRPLRSGAWIWPLLAVTGLVSAGIGAVAHHLIAVVIVTAAVLGFTGLVVAACFLAPAGDRRPRPAKGMLRADVSPLPDPLMQDLPGPAAAPRPSCLHANAVPVDLSDGRRAAWLCPDCDEGFGPGWRSAELSPDASWPPVRRMSR